MTQRLTWIAVWAYLIFAVGVSIYIQHLQPGPSWNVAGGIGEIIGRAVALIALPGIIPLLVWAIRGCNSDHAKPYQIAWVALGVIFTLATLSMKYTVRDDAIVTTFNAMQQAGP